MPRCPLCGRYWGISGLYADIVKPSKMTHLGHWAVPSVTDCLLFSCSPFVIVRIDRGDLVWINVTTNPTAEWIARQITEAFPWDGAPRCMIRDRDEVPTGSDAVCL